MRRIIAATALVSSLFLAAACSDDGNKVDAGNLPAIQSAPAVDPSVAAAGDKALSADTKAICDQADRTTKSFGNTFIADLKLQIDSASKDSASKKAAQQKIDQDVQSFSYALRGMAQLTSDTKLQGALTAMSQQVTALKGDITKFNAEKMSQLTATLDKACGKA